MTDRQLIRLALDTLTVQEFDVWISKHYANRGRRAGSQALGITEDAWRYRLTNADRKLKPLLTARKDAA